MSMGIATTTEQFQDKAKFFIHKSLFWWKG